MPITLIIGSTDKDNHRPHEEFIDNFNNTYMAKFSLGVLTNVDSCGTRSVYVYNKSGFYDYKSADDFPEDIYRHLGIYLESNQVPVHLYLRQEDPGIGIILPQDTEKNVFSYRETTSLANVADPIIKKFNYKKGKSVDAVCDFFLRRAN